jgi:Trypsin-like serine proteases, typically periplasmic, contain C-terminal PDZ domain
MDILAMVRFCIQAIGTAVLVPGENIIYIALLFIVYSQYRRTVRMQEIVYGIPRVQTGSLVITSVVSGIIAGIIISIPMTLLGITFSQDMGIQYMIILSVFLMLINPRFLCFSYSGGILSLASLIFGLKGIDVTSIMVLVGVLHLLEAILIYIDGHRGAVPIFLERKDGSIVGGFTMQRFWPIPIALVVFIGFNTITGESVPTPDWWPLIRPYIDPAHIKEAVFSIAPVAAVLGYTEFTSAYLPEEKCKKSSYKLALFSLVLILLSIASSRIYIFKYIAAVFAPLAHEYIIMREKRMEQLRPSIYDPVDNGVRVLDTMPQGPAEKMGIMPGDTIVSINNRPVVSEEAMAEIFKEYISYIWVDILGRDGKVRTAEYKDYKDGIDGLEILTVPRSREGLITFKEQKSFFARLIDKKTSK